MRRIEIAFLLAVGAFLIGFCLLGLLHYEYSLGLLRFPLLAAGTTLVIVAVQLGLLASESRSEAMQPYHAPASDPLDKADDLVRGKAWLSVLWLVSIIPLVLCFGYPVGLAIYLLCFLRYAGEGWILSLAVAGLSLLLSYGLFIMMLGVSLPSLPFWWPA